MEGELTCSRDQLARRAHIVASPSSVQIGRSLDGKPRGNGRTRSAGQRTQSSGYPIDHVGWYR